MGYEVSSGQTSDSVPLSDGPSYPIYFVLSGGTAENTTINGGLEVVSSGGVASTTTVFPGNTSGYFLETISPGVTNTAIVLENGDVLSLYGNLYGETAGDLIVLKGGTVRHRRRRRA